jgi:parallel beta-helix repeat protein
MKHVTIAIIFLLFLCSITLSLLPLGQGQLFDGPLRIQADGTVNPASAPVQRNKNIYTLTGNIGSAIFIEKDGITLDGAGYLANGTSSASGTVGVDISNRNNVTIKNLHIGKSFDSGISVKSSSGITIQDNFITDVSRGISIEQSSSNTISGNRLSRIFDGIYLSSCSNNVVTQNSITDLMQNGIALERSSSNNVISKNTIVGQTSRGWSPSEGIQMVSATNNTLEGNTISSMFMAGIRMQGSPRNKIASNVIDNGGFTGLSMEWASDGNAVTGNIVENCRAESGGNGVLLESSTSNVFGGNSLRNNTVNLYISGVSPTDWVQDLDSSNTVEGKRFYFWVNQKDRVVPAGAGYIVLVNCNNVTVRDDAFGRGQGIELAYSSNCTVTHNTIADGCKFHLYSSSANTISLNAISGTDRGLFLEYSCNGNVISNNSLTGNNQAVGFYSCSGNTLMFNTFANNKDALYFSSASNNTIYENNFQSNTHQFDDVGIGGEYGTTQSMKASKGSVGIVKTLAADVTTVNFMGPPALSSNFWDNGARGNFWSDYNGTDANGDGVGDTAFYLYGNNQDSYPLMNPISVSGAPSAPIPSGQPPENTTATVPSGTPDGARDSSSSGDAVGQGILIGYVGAGVAAVVAIAATCVFFLRRRKVAP